MLINLNEMTDQLTYHAVRATRDDVILQMCVCA